MKVVVKAAIIFLAAGLATAQQAPTPAGQDGFNYVAPTRVNYLKFAGETEKMLHEDVLEVWFPRSDGQ